MTALGAYGPDLRKQLLAQLAAAIDKHRDTLHPEDAQMAPLELRSWMKACDARWDQSTLDHGLSFSLSSVRRGSTPREQRMRDMRLPHAIYAAEALKHRFGVDRTKELPA